MLGFVASQPRCVVAMEACASAHHWGREIGKLGHELKLVPPIYVKPFVKRQKNDAADAEAICEAASRPTMRFVAVKTREQQAQGMLFRTRDLLVRQRAQTINALRDTSRSSASSRRKGPAHVERLAEAIEDADSGLPARFGSWARCCSFRSPISTRRSRSWTRNYVSARARRRTDGTADECPGNRAAVRDGDPGLCAADGELPARARLCGLAGSDSPAELDRREVEAGEDFQDGSATSGGCWFPARWRQSAGRCGVAPRRTRGWPASRACLVAVALANRMARIAWALMTNNEHYRAPAVTA